VWKIWNLFAGLKSKKILKMKKTFLIITAFLFSLTVVSQTIENFPCDTLIRMKDSKILAAGMIDHNELELSWIKFEVKKDSINFWAEDYLKKTFFSESKMDELDKKIYKQELEYLILRLEKAKKFIEESDRLFFYSTPEIYWKSLAGQDGIAILRDCKVIGVIILAQS